MFYWYYGLCVLSLGDPFKVQYWLAQLLVYLTVMLLEKLMVGPLVAVPFWEKVSDSACTDNTDLCMYDDLLPLHTHFSLAQLDKILPQNEYLRIAIVIFIVPFVVNVSDILCRHKMCTSISNTHTHTHTHTHTQTHRL